MFFNREIKQEIESLQSQVKDLSDKLSDVQLEIKKIMKYHKKIDELVENFREFLLEQDKKDEK